MDIISFVLRRIFKVWLNSFKNLWIVYHNWILPQYFESILLFN